MLQHLRGTLFRNAKKLEQSTGSSIGYRFRVTFADNIVRKAVAC